MGILEKLFGGGMNRTTGLAYGATDVGRKRGNNEDCYRLLLDRDLYVVSDGMGGHNAGEVASLNAVEMVDKYFTPNRILEMRPEYNEHPLNKGDKVLLYSDGLWDLLSDEEIYTIALKDVPPEKTCWTLIAKANEAGGDDNVTVLLVKIGN